MTQDWISETGIVMLLNFNIKVPRPIFKNKQDTESTSISKVIYSEKSFKGNKLSQTKQKDSIKFGGLIFY